MEPGLWPRCFLLKLFVVIHILTSETQHTHLEMSTENHSTVAQLLCDCTLYSASNSQQAQYDVPKRLVIKW